MAAQRLKECERQGESCMKMGEKKKQTSTNLCQNQHQSYDAKVASILPAYISAFKHLSKD